MTKKVLILGSGASGSIVANKLSRELRNEIARDEVEIKILDKDNTNINQAGFTFLPFGLYAVEDIMRSRNRLISPRINSVFGENGEVTRINIEEREVKVKSGETYDYDYLLISTGCTADMSEIQSTEFNTFYTSIDDALKIGNLIRDFDKGDIAILTLRMPIPCPGAPSKFTVLLEEYLRYVRNIRENINIKFLWPVESIGPPAYNSLICKILEERDVTVMKKFTTSKIDSKKKQIISDSGEKVKYDLLIGIPPHKCIDALITSDITDESGWIPVDKYTLQYRKSNKEKYDEVYAIGDTGPAEILKTGIGAHYQALITAQNLINDILGNETKVRYMGETGCPFINSLYTSFKKGEAHIPMWTYNKPLEPFNTTKMGWLMYRMYYYIYWDTAIKALI